MDTTSFLIGAFAGAAILGFISLGIVLRMAFKAHRDETELSDRIPQQRAIRDDIR